LLKSEEDHYIFDFQELGNAPPFGLLLTAHVLNDFIAFAGVRFPDKDVYIEYSNYEDKTYHAHMGFFQSFGLKFGKRPGDARGSSGYLPLDLIKFDVSDAAASHIAREKLIEAIRTQASRLAGILIQNDSGAAYDSLRYSFIEIFRNIAEHSSSDTVWYAAQYWPQLGRAEIGILDKGRGIYHSLSENKELELKDERHAISLSLMPGISRFGINKQSFQYNTTGIGNGGYGLYMISQIFGTGHQDSFLVASGSTSITVSEGRFYPFDIPHLPGTSIRLKFNLANLDELQSRLDQLNDRAATLSSTPLSKSASATGRLLFD
jgi:hypothetical protein